MTDRVLALSTTFLPMDQARRTLVPAVRLARVGAVALARTVRHWELILDGGDPSLEADSGEQDPPADLHPRSGSPAAAAPTAFQGELSGDDLPVQDWAELSFADAQSRLSSCGQDELRTLLAYEQTHGHRPQYTMLLEQRLAESA